MPPYSNSYIFSNFLEIFCQDDILAFFLRFKKTLRLVSRHVFWPPQDHECLGHSPWTLESMEWLLKGGQACKKSPLPIGYGWTRRRYEVHTYVCAVCTVYFCTKLCVHSVCLSVAVYALCISVRSCLCSTYFCTKLRVHCVVLYEVLCALCIFFVRSCMCTVYFCTKLCVYCASFLYEACVALCISVRTCVCTVYFCTKLSV
jgi:hypothetical protein